MKIDMLRAINEVKGKASGWTAIFRRAWAEGRKTSQLFSPALAVPRGIAKATLGIAASIPLQIWLAAAALIFAGLWLQEHDAKVRAAAELHQATRQAAQRVAALEAEADAALRQANENNAAAIAQLEARRQALGRQAADLTAQVEASRSRQAKQRAELAALPAPELARRLSNQLGPGSVLSRPLSVVRDPLQGHSHPEAGSAAASNEAAAGTTLPQNSSRKQLTTDHGQRTSNDGQLTLSEHGQRQVILALAERDACREQGAMQEHLFANCNERVAAGEAEIRTQADSLAKLNAALGAKDAILAAREAEHRAELRAARGTWRGRAWRAIKWIGAGVVVGQLLR